MSDVLPAQAATSRYPRVLIGELRSIIKTTYSTVGFRVCNTLVCPAVNAARHCPLVSKASATDAILREEAGSGCALVCMDESACAAISRFNMAGDSLARFPVDFRALFAALAFRASGEGCECCGYGGAARRIFSIGWRQTTQTGRVECRTFSAQSTHMATWPHGTSRAARGSTKQTAHGSVSSGGACSRAFSR
eukprot:1776656-Pleurochrysis_carterae.AAC.1